MADNQKKTDPLVQVFYQGAKEELQLVREGFSDHEYKQCGVTNKELIRVLRDKKVSAAEVGAIELIPLVLVAWSDQHVDSKERRKILVSAKDFGIAEGSCAYKTLNYWMEHEPPSHLFDMWNLYIVTLLKELDHGTQSELVRTVDDLIKKVARASGGILGLGQVSSEEKESMEQIRLALSA